MTSARTALYTDSYKQHNQLLLPFRFFDPQKGFQTTYFPKTACIKFQRIAELNEVNMSDCMIWQFDMIAFLISTAVLTHSMHTDPGQTEKVMNQIPEL